MWYSVSSTDQLVLVGSHSGEDCLGEDPGLVVVLAQVVDTRDGAVRGVDHYKVNPWLELVHGVKHNLPVLVELVVGQLHLLKGNNLLGKLVRAEGAVRMAVQAVGRRRVTLASNQPAGPVVGIPRQGMVR